ncbi:hypothetical protein PCC7424_1187 [Gloeothece citriformis PCC 7424]|uniref:Uncharacterized protein n=1 Tax=Gloeothece citriformis (strain PCC 7424) TaxID=65393 RepID=B7K769_GLOC7|nr:hypothetical protein [Gloeothece citriformis]ACK69637.1 hypothetical protein PCC7424_1187 [Gloeothece citriformis PCC 7424]
MFTSPVDIHQDAITISVASPLSIEAAIEEGIKELTEPNGHHDDLHFKTFEVLTIQGTIESPGPGKGGKVALYQVILRAFGSHVHHDHDH